MRKNTENMENPHEIMKIIPSLSVLNQTSEKYP